MAVSLILTLILAGLVGLVAFGVGTYVGYKLSMPKQLEKLVLGLSNGLKHDLNKEDVK